MKKENAEKADGLPENAYRELKEGEEYKPVMPPYRQYREVTPWSVCWGLVMVATSGWWNEIFTTRMTGIGEALADKAKIVFKVNSGAAILGSGYIIGLKYSLIICAGSFLVWLVIIPLLSAFWGSDVTLGNNAIIATAGSMTPEQIFTAYARHIGIGGIATAGVISIIKSWGIIKSANGMLSIN